MHSDQTKIVIYEKYCAACVTNQWNHVGRRKFYVLWEQLLLHISVPTPSSDLCFTCQDNKRSIQLSARLSDQEKMEKIKAAEKHLARVRSEREYYNGQVTAAQSQWKNHKLIPLTCGHYSYDFTQQIHYLFDCQQTGPEYFKIAQKCGIFGVCNGGENCQVNYLIDEAENPGKGADRLHC